MAISGVGGLIYTNQNMHIAAAKQLDHQSRVDFQNIVASSIANDKAKEVQETRALEEEKALNTEREHNRDTSDETTGEKDAEKQAVLKAGKKIKDNNSPDSQDDTIPHILDIRV
jgi:hypothetical protein